MDSPAIKGDPNTPKKRPCKGFRACWECKRRKVQTNTTTESNPSSPGGLTTGSSQETVEDENPCPLHIGERLSKLELLFEKFVCRKPSSSLPSEAPTSPSVSSSEFEKFPKYGLPEISSDAKSIASLGESILAGQSVNWNSAPSIRTLVDNGEQAQPMSPEALRKSLSALLPTQKDADTISAYTNAWMALMSTYKPAGHLIASQDLSNYALDMSAVAKEHPTIIARTLLHLAISMGSLPPDFDKSSLTNVWSLEGTVQNYVTAVTSLVTNSDEHMCTLPGLETLHLLSLHHMNSANLRQAWLANRRAMNLAHLMGFHRIVTQPTPPNEYETIENAKYIWRQFVDLDRFLGLHLRLPFASDDYPTPEDVRPSIVHRAELAALSRQVSELDRNITPHTYVQALAIDEKLESLMKRLPKQFWEIPNIAPVRSLEAAEMMERLIVHVWHFELKIFLHLPFLLRAPLEPRFEYSKITALQASRNVILRWFALRKAGNTQTCCRIAELGVFFATVTIALDILTEMGTKEKAEVQRTRGSDFAMICRVIGEMEKLGKFSEREKIAKRTSEVLKKLLCSLDPSRQKYGNVKLKLPYFGTIDIGYNTVPKRQTGDIPMPSISHEGGGAHLPVFSFASNGLWPPMGTSWDDGLDFDIILFDGLEDRDTEGNWVF